MNPAQYLKDKYNVDFSRKGGKGIYDLPMSRNSSFLYMLADLEFTKGAEIGVEQGKYAFEMLLNIPQLMLYCIDSWECYSRYADIVQQDKMDRYYRETKERLFGYNCYIIRKRSMDAVKEFPEGLLDFVYIDGNHDFEFVVNDIIYWSKIVRSGGIVAGHDYRPEGKEKRKIPFHVIQAVLAYTDSYNIGPIFLTRQDRSPSWFWIKP